MGLKWERRSNYRRREAQFDETTQTRKIYKNKTQKLRNSIKELWFQ